MTGSRGTSSAPPHWAARAGTRLITWHRSAIPPRDKPSGRRYSHCVRRHASSVKLRHWCSHLCLKPRRHVTRRIQRETAEMTQRLTATHDVRCEPRILERPWSRIRPPVVSHCEIGPTQSALFLVLQERTKGFATRTHSVVNSRSDTGDASTMGTVGMDTHTHTHTHSYESKPGAPAYHSRIRWSFSLPGSAQGACVPSPVCCPQTHLKDVPPGSTGRCAPWTCCRCVTLVSGYVGEVYPWTTARVCPFPGSAGGRALLIPDRRLLVACSAVYIPRSHVAATVTDHSQTPATVSYTIHAPQYKQVQKQVQLSSSESNFAPERSTNEGEMNTKTSVSSGQTSGLHETTPSTIVPVDREIFLSS